MWLCNLKCGFVYKFFPCILPFCGKYRLQSTGPQFWSTVMSNFHLKFHNLVCEIPTSAVSAVLDIFNACILDCPTVHQKWLYKKLKIKLWHYILLWFLPSLGKYRLHSVSTTSWFPLMNNLYLAFQILVHKIPRVLFYVYYWHLFSPCISTLGKLHQAILKINGKSNKKSTTLCWCLYSSLGK